MTNSPPQTCELCGLPAPPGSAHLKTAERDLAFCCEGCRGIWRMLHPDAAPAPGDKEGKDT